MASRLVPRSLISKQTLTLTSLFSRSVSSLSRPPLSLSPFSLLRLRPLVAVAGHLSRSPSAAAGVRAFSTRKTASSLNDTNPNWSNRPPKETILLDGCDFEHWLVVMEPPEGEPTRDEIIDSYIKTLSMVVGSEAEARMKMYSVSTRCYFAFGALVSEELSYKIKELPKVRWVLPDSYLDVKNKDYGGEPFINGQAVPYDPKYHEEWIRNNARANERNRRNDRPRNFDRSRNFERRRENMQNRVQTRDVPPMQNSAPNNVVGMQQNPNGMTSPNMAGVPPNNMGGMPQSNNMGIPPNNMGGMQQPNSMGVPPNNMGGMQHPNNMGVPPSNMGGMQQPNTSMPPNNMGRMPQHNMGPPNNSGGMQPGIGGMPHSSMGGNPQGNFGVPPPNPGWSGNVTGRDATNLPNFQNRDAPNGGGMAFQNREMPSQGPNREFQNSYPPNSMPGGNIHQA